MSEAIAFNAIPNAALDVQIAVQGEKQRQPGRCIGIDVRFGIQVVFNIGLSRQCPYAISHVVVALDEALAQRVAQFDPLGLAQRALAGALQVRGGLCGRGRRVRRQVKPDRAEDGIDAPVRRRGQDIGGIDPGGRASDQPGEVGFIQADFEVDLPGMAINLPGPAHIVLAPDAVADLQRTRGGLAGRRNAPDPIEVHVQAAVATP